MIREIERKAASGYAMLVVLLLLTAGFIYWLIRMIAYESVSGIIFSIVVLSILLVLYFGFFIVNPNEAKVLQLFGKYVGTAREPGLRWANPFYTKVKVSMRVRNFETGKMKVNDNRGNPIEMAAVVVWKVVDTAEAVFEVDDYVNYVHVQSEAATRNLATGYPYDAFEEDEPSLVGNIAEISERLKMENQDRLEKAGIQIIETRISHLAYSPEIAQAMLRRQQAAAVIAARRQIVEGAVGMVEHAIEMLSEKNVLDLDEERKASMVSNLMVVLCSEHETQPVVNTGSLYT
jgi:regulator of protease activity HflC (stomatin/prohibitin superfamily)